MTTPKIFRSLAVILMFAAIASAQDKAKTIDALIQSYFDYGQFNGTVLVADKGKVIYKKGFGMANMEWEIPNAADTKFRVGSVTKQFTAALILQLVEEGKVKLDGKLSDYLPDYRKDTGDKITIHQILNHTSGVPNYTTAKFFADDSRNFYKVDDFVKKFAGGDLEFEPGTKFNYSNSGYFLLGAVIEKVTGKTYAQVLQERIFTPLGMTNSGYDLTSPLIKKRANGYQKTPDGYVNADYLDMSIPYSAGSLYSTVEDLYKWDQSLYQDKILSAESKKKMFTPGLSDYGYGFNIYDLPLGKTAQKIKIIQHGGGINGFNCLLTRVVDRQQTVILLDNVGLGRYHSNITNSIINVLNGQPFEQPKKSIAETLGASLKTKSGAEMVAEYRKLKTANPATYDFAEGELNTLGYNLLRMNRVKDAVEIFKLNVEMFPNSSNPYDSLGEVYLADGQKELALVNYKKAVELDPKNTAAAQIVKRLEGKETKVDPAMLGAYVGDYELAPNFILTITKDGEKLFGEATGQGKIGLEMVSETEFSATQFGLAITFVKDAAGKVTALILNQGGQKINAKKIK